MLAKQHPKSGVSVLLLFVIGLVLGGLLGLGTWWQFGGTEVPSAPGPKAVGVLPSSTPELGVAALPDEAAVAEGDKRTPASARGTGAIEVGFGVLGMGRVTDAEGASIENATVALAFASGQQLKARTSKSGAWSLVDLEPGAVHVEVKCEGYVGLEEDAVIPAVRSWRFDRTLSQGMELPVRFVDPAGGLVKVAAFAWAEEGALARRLGVVALTAPPGREVYGVNNQRAGWSKLGRYFPASEREGVANLGPDYQGLLRVAARPPVWVALTFGSAVLESRQLLEVPTELVFTVDVEALGERLGDLRVRVVGEDGTPLSVAPAQRSPLGWDSVEYEDGQMVLRGRPPGRGTLVVGGKEWETLRLPYFMPFDADLDLGTLVLGRACDLVFLVVDEDGAPLQTDVLIARTGRLDFPWLLTFERGFRSGADGEARVPFMARGPSVMQAGGRDGLARVARRVDTSADPIADLVVPRGVPVRFQRGTKLPPGARCMIEDSMGAPIYVDYWLPDHLTLQPGDYVIRIGTQDGEVSHLEFHVAGPGLVVSYGGTS